jgi:hypothetical protein
MRRDRARLEPGTSPGRRGRPAIPRRVAPQQSPLPLRQPGYPTPPSTPGKSTVPAKLFPFFVSHHRGAPQSLFSGNCGEKLIKSNEINAFTAAKAMWGNIGVTRPPMTATANVFMENIMPGVVHITRNTLTNFCLDFLKWPYLCYIEHGLHALFFTRLYAALDAEDRSYSELHGQRFCVVQKEYPTKCKLGKSRRQHWDVSVISPDRASAFDYQPLAAVVEFGLNCDSDHLVDDIQRLSHPDSNVQNGFIVHLYRLSNSFSDRDWSPKSKKLVDKQCVQNMLPHKELPSTTRPLKVLYGVADITRPHKSGLWSITRQDITPIPDANDVNRRHAARCRSYR